MTKKRLWLWRLIFFCLLMGGGHELIWKWAIEDFLEEGGAIQLGTRTLTKENR